jgi:Tfp pilus assembly protein PilF
MTLTSDERREKQKVLLHDTVALSSLAGVVVVLSFATYFLFHSFNAHRAMLEQRWQERGQIALAGGNPIAAMNDLHAALAYAPDDRNVQIELAMALAAAGHTQEAQAYFGTLLEGEPGSGMINLQLGRLAAKQNNVQLAVDRYEAAIDGTWNGDAFARRRDIRLELARYLIAQRRLAEARNLLLITAGNGPDNLELQLTVAGMLVQAEDATDALDVYRTAARSKQTRLRALEGAGVAALDIGRFDEARSNLQEALENPGFEHQPEALQTEMRGELSAAEGVLALYPAVTLKPAERARRIAKAAVLAQARLLACTATNPTYGNVTAAHENSGAAPQRTQLLTGLAMHLRQLNPLGRSKTAGQASGTSGEANSGASSGANSEAAGNGPAGLTAAAALAAQAQAQLNQKQADQKALNQLPSNQLPSNQLPLEQLPLDQDPLAKLAAQWTPVPTGVALQSQLLSDPGFAQNVLDLVYETERVTANACGTPTGADAALLRIATMPNGMERQP